MNKKEYTTEQIETMQGKAEVLLRNGQSITEATCARLLDKALS